MLERSLNTGPEGLIMADLEPHEEDHPSWQDFDGPDPVPKPGPIRHGLIISSTFPAFFVMALFFASRWVSIGGDRADSFRSTALAFAAVGLLLAVVNIALRRRLERDL